MGCLFFVLLGLIAVAPSYILFFILWPLAVLLIPITLFFFKLGLILFGLYVIGRFVFSLFLR